MRSERTLGEVCLVIPLSNTTQASLSFASCAPCQNAISLVGIVYKRKLLLISPSGASPLFHKLYRITCGKNGNQDVRLAFPFFPFSRDSRDRDDVLSYSSKKEK